MNYKSCEIKNTFNAKRVVFTNFWKAMGGLS